MFEKAKDPEVIAKKISHKPIDYENLNSLTDDFGKHFSLQQELSAKQAFWFHTLNPTIEPSYTPPVIVDVPSELPKDLKAHVKIVFVITSLKNNLRKLKGKEIVENVVHTPSATIIAPGMFKLDLEPLPPRLLQNREVHIDYLRNTQEQANILRAKKVIVKPMNNVKKVRFAEPLISSSNIKQVVQIVLCKFLGTVRFGNDQIARIMGYGNYQLGNVIISRVYYVEGIRHNLFSVGQFCDADLEVAFRKNTCFIRNLEGVDLLSGSRDTNLYTISLDDMLRSSPICLLSKAPKTKSWLWHRRLSHLNFGTLNKLAKDGLARGIHRLKFQKDHLCSACALGKS
ncbi:integrase, catalytic region, zinc finger, CCHC-type containing protein [Tanacetum coccineum]|uniref:Integrase, catalytic region, zinc finger, CCHC-type containing protein n=1 Tax=Tanacetum coccineum TaxID=301880 RepID=A0ABQ5CUY6_9ASTR